MGLGKTEATMSDVTRELCQALPQQYKMLRVLCVAMSELEHQLESDPVRIKEWYGKELTVILEQWFREIEEERYSV
jgi:hypothetical protein